ncbi:MAG: helix-turn-helix transcriptional regulator [Terriglobales bacterium]
MLDIASIGKEVAARRKTHDLTQSELAKRSGLSRATIDALENGRSGELGFSKISRLLTTLGLELRLQEATPKRPTLDDLLAEDRDDQSVDRRG